MFVSKIAAAFTTSALLAAALIGSAGSADAAMRQCRRTSNGHTICTVNRGHYGSDTINVYDPAGNHVANMNIVCTGGSGNRWSATSTYTKSANTALANWWCNGC